MQKHELTIFLQKGHLLEDVPIAVKVIDSALETVWEDAIDIGRFKTLELDAGKYAVQASLPSGRQKSLSCDLRETSQSVTLDVIGNSPRETLEWAALSSKAPLINENESEGKRFQNEDQLRKIWLRLWRRAPNGKWQPEPWTSRPPDREAGLIQFQFDFQQGQYYLQIGAPAMQWRLYALPADKVRVFIKSKETTRSSDEADSIVDVLISSENSDAEILLKYFQNGQFDQAEIVNARVAEKLLKEKLVNPITAVIAGYYLLGLSDLEGSHRDWTNNLANWFEWLPDGALINAWYHLKDNPPNVEIARTRFLDAVIRGIPVYTRGVRLLIDGLSIISDEEKEKSDRYAATQAALKLIRSYGAAIDWRSITTSFIGSDPQSPGSARVGKPDDPNNVLFVSDINADGSNWNQLVTPVQNRAQRSARSRVLTKELIAPEEVVIDNIRRGEREKSIELEQNVELREPGNETFNKVRSEQLLRANSNDQILARVLNLANSQTQGESFIDTSAVELIPGTQSHGAAFERLLSTTNFLSVSYFERALRVIRTVGCVVVKDDISSEVYYGTGFLVSPRLFITNHHLIPSLNEAYKGRVEFNYQDNLDGQLQQKICFAFAPDDFFVTNAELDFSLIALKTSPVSGSAKLYDFGWNHLTDVTGKVLIGECLSCVQHLDGAAKQISSRKIQLTNIFDNFIHYSGDGERLSSGAPLFNDQWEVIGINHASIPKRDEQGRLIARDGLIIRDESGLNQIQCVAHEGIRASRIVRYLEAIQLKKEHENFRDEMLYRKYK